MRLAELSPIGERVTLDIAFFRREHCSFRPRFRSTQPFHLDAEAAKNSVFGALCASGWHTGAGWMKCFPFPLGQGSEEAETTWP